MSQFECSVSELLGENTRDSLDKIKNPVPEIKNKVLNTVDSKIKTEVSGNILSKLTDEKNIKIILLVVIGYLITTSQPFLELLMSTIPYVMTSATETNIVGKILSAVLIAISIIFFTSFF